MQDQRTYTDLCIAQYLESHSFAVADAQDDTDQTDNFFRKIYKTLVSDEFSLSGCDDREIQHVIINYIQPFYRDEGVLCHTVVRELDIINQNSNDLFTSLKQVLQPRTKSGEATLLLLLLHPSVYTQHVKQRQALVQFLIENPDVMDFIDEQLRNLALHEERFITAIHDDFIPKESESIYWSKIPVFGTYTRTKPSLYMAHQLGSLGALGAVSLALKLFPLLLHATTNHLPSTAVGAILSWLCSLFADTALCSSIIHVACKSRQIHHQLIGVSNYLNTVDTFVKMGERIPFLREQPLFLELHEIAVLQQPLNDLRHFLHMSTFSGPSTVMHNWGNVFVAYQKLKNIQHGFLSTLFHVIGELDVAIALAKTMHEDANNEQRRWCFAQFRQGLNEPTLVLKDAWHPLLLQHKPLDQIICNDITFKNGMKNVILTGPNSCGKTVITTGFAAAIAIAQALGFAPASECVLTPFHRIYVVFTAKSEAAKGQSRFTSEVNQIKQMLDHLGQLASEGKFAFVILDEIFTGTNPGDGETAAREFLKYFLQKNVGSHSLMIISTHYQSLTDVAKQSPICANYKVDVQRKNDGGIKRFFKLSPGISLVRVALDMFKNDIC